MVVVEGKQWKCGGGGIQFHYSRSCVEKKVDSRVHVGSMESRYEVDVFVGGKMYKEMRRWMRRRENDKIVEEGNQD